MPEKALITGGAGCIGSELASRLLDLDTQVIVVDNLSSGKREHIEPFLSNPAFQFVPADLTQPGLLDSLLPGVDIVYHLAANPDVKFQLGDPTSKDLQQNILVTYNVLESMRLAGVKRLAFSSTSAVYGIASVMPIPESYAGQPISLYGASKLGCESLIHAFAHLFALDCWIFRFANIVGERVRKTGGTVIGDFVARLRDNPSELLILGNGKQEKSYLLNQECVDAMLYCVAHARGGVQIFNLGCSDSITVQRIAEKVVSHMGLSRVTFRYTGGEGGWLGDVPRFLLDVSKLNRLGWRARYSSEQAIDSAIASVLASRPQEP